MKHNLSRRWFDISSKELLRELGSLRPRDIDILPFGTFRIDRDERVMDWVPDPQSRAIGRGLDDYRGRSLFSHVNPCFFIRAFQEELFKLFELESFDETFFFTFRFPGEWRQARVRIVAEGSDLVVVRIQPNRRISGADATVPEQAIA